MTLESQNVGGLALNIVINRYKFPSLQMEETKRIRKNVHIKALRTTSPLKTSDKEKIVDVIIEK